MTETTNVATPVAEIPKRISSALLRYRVMAYVTGVMLLLLTVAVIFKYGADTTWATSMTEYVGIAHGWLYMVYLLVSVDMAIKVRWRPVSAILILVAGTIPLMSFVAEHFVTKAVREGRRL